MVTVLAGVGLLALTSTLGAQQSAPSSSPATPAMVGGIPA